MSKYKLAQAPIVQSEFTDDVKKAVRPALILGLLAFIILVFFMGPYASIFPAVLVIFAMTIVYYRTMRELILFSHLLNGGRRFHCDSVVDLIHQEAYLEGVAAYMRQVLTSAKYWDEREVIPIKALDKEAAKHAILKAM